MSLISNSGTACLVNTGWPTKSRNPSPSCRGYRSWPSGSIRSNLPPLNPYARMHVCTDVCKPDAYGSAYDKSLNGDENSPPYARMHDFSGGTDTHGDAAEDCPQVCQHCGAPATADAPVQMCAIDGEEFLLHRHCQADWLGDLSIPHFLQRGSNNG